MPLPGWQRGYAGDCRSPDPGSNPGPGFPYFGSIHNFEFSKWFRFLPCRCNRTTIGLASPWLSDVSGEDVQKKLRNYRDFRYEFTGAGEPELGVTGYLTYLSNIFKVVNKDLGEYTRDDVRKVIAHYQAKANRGKISLKLF